MALIVTNEIPGFDVYGVGQVDYTIDGVSGRDFGAAVAKAAFIQSNAIERESEAYSAMVRVRMRKLEDLGEALAIISKAIASMPVDDPESDDLCDNDPRLLTARDLLAKYGIALYVHVVDFDGRRACYITREEGVMRQNDVQLEIDEENNSLQQDMVTLQGLVSKRDNSFSTAAKLIEKVNDTSQTLIGNIGG